MADIDIEMPEGFEAVSVLGKGAMGTVYKAWQPKLKRHVAVKTCTITGSVEAGQDIGRLEDEALTIAQLNHPNIVSLIDVFRDDEAIYLIMEFLDGPPLSRLLNPKVTAEELGAFSEIVQDIDGRRVMREEWILEIAHSVAKALDYAHERNVLHRDIKPANIIMTESRNTKLLDFSIARNENQGKGRTVAGTIFGTVQYMSPEQILSTDLDGRTDIYSLGCTLYHLATGRVPFVDDNEITICMNHVNTPPVPVNELNPTLSEACAFMIMKCLEKETQDRFESSAELSFYSKKVLRGVSSGMDFQAINAMDTGEFSRGDGRTPLPVSDPDRVSRDGNSSGAIRRTNPDSPGGESHTPGITDLDSAEQLVPDRQSSDRASVTGVSDLNDAGIPDTISPNISSADTVREEDDSFKGKQVLTEPSPAAGGDPSKQPKPPTPPKKQNSGSSDELESYARARKEKKKRGLEELASRSDDLDVSPYRTPPPTEQQYTTSGYIKLQQTTAPSVKNSSYEPRSVVGSLIDAKTAELKRQREKQKKLVQTIIAVLIFVILIIALYILRF